MSGEMARLAALAGTWSVEVRDLVGDGGVLATGRAEIRAELGGRSLVFALDLVRDGAPLAARGVLAYDARSERYQLLWHSELAPALRVAEGRGDVRREGLVLEAAERDPESGALARARTALRLAGDDRLELTQLGQDPASGAWRALQRTTYSRVSSAAASAAPPPR
ncbi:MAG: DUF1579 family protein [Planctomycetes bacterium]|nr:DUF1579 family protein [Planctomycetota bacterium]